MADREMGDEPVRVDEKATLELDEEHRRKLVIIALLLKTSVTEYLQTYIDNEWGQLSECVSNSLTVEDFRQIAELLHTKVFAGE